MARISLTTASWKNIEIHSLAAMWSSRDPPLNSSLPSSRLINFAPPHVAITSPSTFWSRNIFVVRIMFARLYLNRRTNRAGPLPQHFQSSDTDFFGPRVIPFSTGQGFQFFQSQVRLPQHQPEFGAFDLDEVREGELAWEGGWVRTTFIMAR